MAVRGPADNLVGDGGKRVVVESCEKMAANSLPRCHGKAQSHSESLGKVQSPQEAP